MTLGVVMLVLLGAGIIVGYLDDLAPGVIDLACLCFMLASALLAVSLVGTLL